MSMRAIIALLIATVGLAPFATAGAAGNSEAVEISRADGGRLKAVLFRPEGAGPFPAVIGLHNCTGLANASGRLGARYRDWGEHLARQGFAVLFPDSNGSRGLGSQCAVNPRTLRADRERVADAVAARIWLQQQSWVVADRVSLLGWSSGAISVLWAVRTPIQVQADGQAGADFRSAVALYPGCRRLNNAAWSARVPTLILIGRADDQTSAVICQRRGRARAQRAGRDPRLCRRVSRLRPPEPAASGAPGVGVLGRWHRPHPHRNPSGRARGCAQARAGVVAAVAR